MEFRAEGNEEGLLALYWLQPLLTGVFWGTPAARGRRRRRRRGILGRSLGWRRGILGRGLGGGGGEGRHGGYYENGDDGDDERG